jgi:hypothetical protein
LECCCTAIFRSLQRCGSRPSSGWTTQRHSETCPKSTPALSWLCA